MTFAGFSLNQANSSRSITDDQFYDYVQAYEKDEIKCTLVASPDCGGSSGVPTHYDFSFSCTDSFEENYQEQIPYLKDLNLTDTIVHVSEKVGDYVNLKVYYRRSGYYVIAQLINGTWTELQASQEAPSRQIMESHQVPLEIYDGYYFPEAN